tara:strand:+ start:10885 stop:12870 length:1986 start_codon:yes stop_codon:yes gene_type:complete
MEENNNLLADSLRVLAMDAVEKAGCGHPGMPMGMAEIAEVLWLKHLKHNPLNPNWLDRDRFVLSNGHGSMLLYGVLHLSGYDLSLDEIKNFRQLESKTPGHPEFGITPGVETTTGPLGQGLANAVGMAIAERILSEKYNTDEYKVIDHKTYAFIGDGCLMEGISHEVCSLAGTLGLGKLIIFYDDNGISIDGDVSGWFTEDIPGRFNSYGWQVIDNVNGHDQTSIDSAICEALKETKKPSIICCKTQIGKGSPNKEGTASAHGSAFGPEEVEITRRNLGWEYEPFDIPAEVYKGWDCTKKGKEYEDRWLSLWKDYAMHHKDLADELDRVMNRREPKDLEDIIDQLIKDAQKNKPAIATRKSSGNTLEKICPHMPELIGGSADLTGSNNTNWSGTKAINSKEFDGNYINYGVREFGMTAIMNGIVLHGGLRPYSGTFLTFLDYAKNAVRLSALMKVPTILVYSHDSIGVGEDGPTHQPIEHLSSLRSMPNLQSWRPCDTSETAIAWLEAIRSIENPTAIILSRQSLPTIERTEAQIKDIIRGGYIIYEPSTKPEQVIISTGSEVSLSIEVAKELESRNPTRVISMPCCERFDIQSDEYKRKILGEGLRRVAIEASHKDWWYKYVGIDGLVIGISSYGESAPGKELFDFYGFTKEKIIKRILA